MLNIKNIINISCIKFKKVPWGQNKIMKKHIVLMFIAILVASSIGVSQEIDNNGIKKDTNQEIQTTTMDFTHTVLAEYATTTWCPNCPTASEALYELFSTDSIPFYYVTLISDVNPNARNRSWFGYFNVVIPSVYFDGGNEFYIGNAGSVPATADAYAEIIEEMGARTDIKDIDLETSVSWDEDAEMTVTVTITNNDDSFYLGFIKSYVTEIESRWDDFSGNPYHYGFLSFAINKFITLKPQETKTITAQWDGKEDHDGLTFEDIAQNNIVVQSAIFQWIPHLTKGYDELPSYTQRFLGFYLDQATATVPL